MAMASSFNEQNGNNRMFFVSILKTMAQLRVVLNIGKFLKELEFYLMGELECFPVVRKYKRKIKSNSLMMLNGLD